MSNSPIVTKSSFPIVLFVALKHPDENLRNRLEKSIAEWILYKGTAVSEKDLKKSFDQCEGTDLEPFYIKGPHLKASIMLSLALCLFFLVCPWGHAGTRAGR